MTDQQQQPATPPSNAAEAQTRLTTLTADKAWGEKLFAGDADTRREYESLTEMAAGGDMIENAIAGIVPGDIPSSDQKHMTETAAMLKELGISDQVVRDQLRGHEVTKAEMDATVAWRARMMKDQAFVKAFLEGDAEAGRKMMLSAIIVSGGVKALSP